MRLEPVRLLQAVIVVFVAALLLSEGLLYAPGARPRLTVEQSFHDLGSGRVALFTNATGSFDANLAQSVFAVAQPTPPTDVYYYYDANYPVSFSSIADWFGLTQHLSVVASARGLPFNLTLVDAVGLAGVLRQPPRANTVLIVASGVLPDTVYTAQSDLLAPWIRLGGTLVWAGDTVGRYEGTPIAPGATFGKLLPVPNGSARFLSGIHLGGTGIVYSNRSVFSDAVYLAYPYAIAGGAFRTSDVLAANGRVLGFLDGAWTNWAAFPIGQGTLVDLAAPGYDVVRLSFSLVNLLQSGAWSPTNTLEGASAFSVASNSPFSSVALLAAPGAGLHLCAFSVEVDYLAPFAARSCA
ncbi:MAG: hypothetical protein L3K13_01360 [Thermoplasmata archaeon]|nr:hypothetical protein [Thermoplasmata archaeon]